ILMTDNNTATFYSSPNSILEHMMSEFNKDSIDQESSIKEDQFQRTIDILSVDVNKTLNNETKSINNLTELSKVDKHSIDSTNEDNNTISKLNLNENTEKGDSTYHFTQTKDLSNDNIFSNQIYSPVNSSLKKLYINTKLDNYLFGKNNFNKNDYIESIKMNSDNTIYDTDKKRTKSISILSEFDEKKNLDSPASTSSLFLPITSTINSQSLSPSDIDEYDFECINIQNNNISTSLESIGGCNDSNSIQKSLLIDNNMLVKSIGDENVNYYNLDDKQLTNVNNNIFKFPSSIDSTNTENIVTKKPTIEGERDPLSPTTIFPPPSYKEACQSLLLKSEEVKKNIFASQFNKNILLRRSSLLRQNSIRYKKGDPRSPLFLSKQSRSLSREGEGNYKLFKEVEDIKDLDKTVYNKSFKTSKSFNKIEENNLLSYCKTSKHTTSTSTLEKESCSVNNLDNACYNLSNSLKSIDSTVNNSLLNNNCNMESNVLSQQRESSFIIEDHNNISLNEDKSEILNQELLQNSKDESFDFEDVTESAATLYGPSFSLSKISENADSVEEPIDIAPKFHTFKEKSSGRRGSLSIFGVTPHRRGKSEDNSFLNKDNTDILQFDNDQDVFLGNNPLESVENVAIRDRSKNSRETIGSSRESKCRSQFIMGDNYGVQCLSKSNTDLTNLETSKESELEFTKELNASYDDNDLQVIQSGDSQLDSKNDKKEKLFSKKSDSILLPSEGKVSKRHGSLKEFNLTEKEKELEEKLTSSINKAKGNDKGSKGILGSLFGGKKKNSKPSLQGIFPNSGLGSKTISESTFESINHSCNLIVGDQKKSSTFPNDVMKTKSQVSFTTTDAIMGRRHSSAIIENTLGGKEKKNRISKKIKIHNTAKKDYLPGKLPSLKVVCSFNIDDCMSKVNSIEDVQFTKRILEYNWFSMSDLSLLENDNDSSNYYDQILENEFIPFRNSHSKHRSKTIENNISIYFKNGHSYCSIDLSELLSPKEEIYDIPENVIITEDMCYLDLNTLEFKPTNRKILPSNEEGVTISLGEENNLSKVDHLGNVDVSNCLIDMHPHSLSPELTSFRILRKNSLPKQTLSRSNSEYLYDSGKKFCNNLNSSVTTSSKNLQTNSLINIFEDFIKLKIIQRISGRKYYHSPPNSKIVKTNLEKQNLFKKSLPDDIRIALNSNDQFGGGVTTKNTLSGTETRKISTDLISLHSSSSNKHYNAELLKMSEWTEYYNWDPQNQELYKNPEFKKLSRTEKEKQNTIRELVGTEKNYCEVLLLLRQCFNHNLREESIFVNDGDVNLVPQPATDNLIKFHMSFLSSLKSRLEESVVITEISDIILNFFANQNDLNVVYDSYTELCSGSDEMKRLYDVTYSKNTKFSNYCNKLNRDVSFKGRDYKSCLGLLSQRCTKYPMLLERIAKSEKNKDLLEKASAAYETMKLFTATIDSNLNKYQINKLWDSFKQMIDKNSYGLYCGNAFTLQDLIYQAPCNSRKIVCISRADYFRQSRKGREEKSILLLALFDDILVFFVIKNNIAYFFNLDNHQAVFSIKHTSTRPIERQNKLVIMHLSKKNTDMIILRFTDKEKMQDFEMALRETKSKIKNLSDDEEDESELFSINKKQSVASKHNLHYAPIEDTFGLDAKTFEKYNTWWSELESIFDNRKTEDLMVTKYVQDRISWYKQLKAHIASMPFAKNKQIPNKTIKAIYDKFDELDRIRVFDNAEYIECLKKLERDDCKDLFDTWNGIFCKNDSDDSDSDGKKKSCVKRVSTYAGQQDKSNTKAILSNYRRHTTVPDLSSDEVVLSPTKEDLSNFALIRGDNSRRAAEKLLKENIELRSEVVRLRSDVTLMTAQVASLKGCKNIDSYSNSSKLEELREKQMELVEREKKNKEQFDAREKKLLEREKLLLEREAKCEITEKDLLTKWQAYYKHKVNPASGGSSTSLMHDTEMPSTPTSENPYNLPHAGYYGESISKVICNSKENSFVFSPIEQSTRSNGLPIKSKSHSSIHSDNRQINALPVHLASKSEITKNKKK
uniref:DH domain-containing protein n=1 Tax=Strongyloides stercoralis TaxID=6248 RepID=A0AAF5I235_STRER